MDQLLRLNEETLKWHVLCQLLSSSVLERLLKTLYEVCPSFNADTTIVARLYHETEQACLDVVKNFILIGEANRLLQGSSPGPASQTTTPVKRPVAETQPMRRLAPKPINTLLKPETSPIKQQPSENGTEKPNPSWVNQINQNIQLQLKQLNGSQGSPTSSTANTPSSPSPGPLSQLPSSRLSPSPTTSLSPEATQALTAQLTAHLNKQQAEKSADPTTPVESVEMTTPAESEAAPSNSSNSTTPTKPGEAQKFEKQVSELKNYMDEVKALFDVFNDPSPKNKDAVNALSQAISVNSAVAQELSHIIKTEPELPQYPTINPINPINSINAINPMNSISPINPMPTQHYFPIQPIITPQHESPPAPIPALAQKRSSKEKLNCKDCGQMFQYSYQMERHIATRHSYIKKIICDICKKTFGSPGALKRHHETIHQKIKRFTCEDCGKKFGRKDHMKFHISTVHSQKKEIPIDQSIIDAAISNATQKTELRKPDDPLDELKQRIRDMSENHARELNLQQQLQQQQLHQQHLQQHILAQQQQQQQNMDLQTVINSINHDIMKTGSPGSVGSGSVLQMNGNQLEVEMEEETVDVMEQGVEDYSNSSSSTPQYNTDVTIAESATISPAAAHVTVT